MTCAIDQKVPRCGIIFSEVNIVDHHYGLESPIQKVRRCGIMVSEASGVDNYY